LNAHQLVSELRFAMGRSDVFQPLPMTSNERFKVWVAAQEAAGRRSTVEQLEWLTMIRDHIATSRSIGVGDFAKVPFNQEGGLVKAGRLFGQTLPSILAELNEVLAG
jgi:type I restriction enzyme, R subunit